MKLLSRGFSLLSVVVLLLAPAIGNADIIYVGDSIGNVGVWDTSINTGVALGTVAGVSQVIGLAYDPATNAVIVLDRGGNTVHTMDATTGVNSPLFNPGFTFQGGAVLGGVLYGIDESTQTLEAFSLPGFANQGLTGPAFSAHTHALGLSGGQLIIANSTGIYSVDTAGNQGALLVAATGNFEDVEGFGGDYLAARFATSLSLVDGVTGADSIYLTSAQLISMGVTGSVSGVAIRSAIPEPAAMGFLVLVGLGFISQRRRVVA